MPTDLHEWLRTILEDDIKSAQNGGDLVAEQSAAADLHVVETHKRKLGVVDATQLSYCEACGPAQPYPCQTVRYVGAAHNQRPGYDARWSPRPE